MAREFDIPAFYRSSIISKIKKARQITDHRKKDRTPSIIDLGSIRLKIARHFGLCFGVENAIEIAYRAIAENPDKRVFLLSEMIHNPHVNEDLQSRGVRFLLNTDGSERISFDELCPDDIVIVPAFGTTTQLFQKLADVGIDPQQYNTTCPFVEKVWKRAAQLGDKGYSVVIHGKHRHEETRATFSHAELSAPSLVIRDITEARFLASYIEEGSVSDKEFLEYFDNRFSQSFSPQRDLERIGVVNQTTMLATETQEISQLLREAMLTRYGSENISHHFADTRDTLCYATSENQTATYGLIQSGGDVAIVVGGYNSSNTSHLVELCEQHCPTFYIKGAEEILDLDNIRHLDMHAKDVKVTKGWFPKKDNKIDVLITAGASCPDALVDQVISHLANLCQVSETLDQALSPYEEVVAAQS